METRANYIIVGLMTLVAIFAAFVAIYWIGRFDTGADTMPLDVRIRGSVSGLGPGSTVSFNGITVGRVTGLELDADDPGIVIARTEIREDVPVREDTRASIGIRGLSGGAFVQLEGGSPDATPLLASVNNGGRVIIEGDPSSMNELIARANSIAARTDRVIRNLEKLVDANSQSVTTTLKNAETFSDALARNSEGIDKLLGSAGRMAQSIETLSEKLDGTVTRAEAILSAIDPEAVRSTVSDIEASASAVREVTEGVDAEAVRKVISDLTAMSERASAVLQAVDPQKLSATIDNASQAVDRANQIVAAVEPDRVRNAVGDIEATARSAREVTEGLDGESIRKLVADLGTMSERASAVLAAVEPERVATTIDNAANAAEGASEIVTDVGKVTRRFGERAEEIDNMVTDASEMMARLNESSKRIDEVLVKVDDLLGSGEGSSVMADLRETLAEFRNTARNLNAQVSTVAGSITRFTDRGLGDTQGLIRDARQSIARINRVISNLESNPSSLITGGGSGIPESGGRPRR